MIKDKKILHIAPDEKFIKSANWQFEKAFPCQNHFFIYLENGVKKLRFFESADNVEIVELWQLDFSKLLDEIKKYDLVVLHGLKYFQSKIVLNLYDSVQFLWLFWGGEIYDNPMAFKDSMIGKKSKQKFQKTSVKKRLLNSLRPIYYAVFKKSFLPEQSILKAAKKLGNVGVLHKEDFDFLKNQNLISEDANHIKMTYYPLEFIFRGNEDINVNGGNILLGNSASITNNHIEALELISKLNIKDQKIIAPLNYGSKEYAHEIASLGKNQFKQNFEPLLDFMPLEDYNKLVQQCGFVIMNHYRQQAVGNILAMLWMGAKVFLDEQNTFYHYLKRIGIHVFSVRKDLTPENDTVFNRLNSKEVSENREILRREISMKVLEGSLRKQINNILV